jgi:hypothetical protein
MRFNQNETSKWARTDNWLSDPNKSNRYGIYCEITTGTIDGDNGKSVTSIISNSTQSYVGFLPIDLGLAQSTIGQCLHIHAILLQRHESPAGFFSQKQLQLNDPSCAEAPNACVMCASLGPQRMDFGPVPG